MNEGKVVGGKPVIARRHATALFDPVEEPPDPVASAVEIRAEADRIAAIAFRRDISPCALLHGKLSDPVGVVATNQRVALPRFSEETAVFRQAERRVPRRGSTPAVPAGHCYRPPHERWLIAMHAPC